MLATTLGTKSASARISSPLCDATTKAAIQFASGQAPGKAVSASVAALAQEVIRSMFLTKLKLAVLTVLALGAVATGAGYLSGSLAGINDDPKPVRATSQQPRITAKSEKPQTAAPGRMMVTGHVLDPTGKPVPWVR